MDLWMAKLFCHCLVEWVIPLSSGVNVVGKVLWLTMLFSPANDLAKFSVWNQIMRVLTWFSVVGIDLPCNTWSRARRAPEWSRLPKPLRSREHIFGLPFLKPSDQQKVLAANRMFFGAVKVIRKCLKIGVAGYLENPASSWVWETPQMLRLMQHPQVCIVRVDMCQYNVQWKKPQSCCFLVWPQSTFWLALGNQFVAAPIRSIFNLVGLLASVFWLSKHKFTQRLSRNN